MDGQTKAMIRHWLGGQSSESLARDFMMADWKPDPVMNRMLAIYGMDCKGRPDPMAERMTRAAKVLGNRFAIVPGAGVASDGGPTVKFLLDGYPATESRVIAAAQRAQACMQEWGSA